MDSVTNTSAWQVGRKLQSSTAAPVMGRVDVESAFIGVGCNRTVGAVAWGPQNLVAFGAHNAVAIFSPEEGRILVTLPGHKDFVNCVLWLPDSDGLSEQLLLSGSADGAINLWAYLSVENKWRIAAQVTAHERAVTCMAALMVSPSVALLSSTSSDLSVRIWNIFLPSKTNGSKAMVATSLIALPGSQQTFLLAVGGLDHQIHLYTSLSTEQFTLVCQVKGHQDWIRALDFQHGCASDMILLASSSQDKSIRIWKISRWVAEGGVREGRHRVELSLKAFIDGPVFKVGNDIWQVSLESLLLGHEDWVYSVRWRPCSRELSEASSVTGAKAARGDSMCVLSASMDRTMMIWRPDTVSGIWMNEVTVGELVQSALGFYGGVWSPRSDAILAHAHGGSFHLWKNLNMQTGQWQPQLAPSGHSAPVTDMAWAKTGQFLLSVSHDQTARLFACWNWSKDTDSRWKTSWHEIGRPQVHGHDFNCLAVVRGPGNHCYVSGADEKVARVFEAPGAVLDTLTFTSGGKQDGLNRAAVHILGANMSALGLSQKPIYTQGRNSFGMDSAVGKNHDEGQMDNMEAVANAVSTVLTEPPLEEHLAQNTLWPEVHKLYGHGNELFAMCSDHAGKLIASACKAQSAAFAQIWLWEVKSWRPIGQLKSHVLTVTQLEFSHNDRFLLSVSRDRHLSIFELTKTESEMCSSPAYKLLMRIDAHKRIIWTCSWSCCDRFFATGSRDKVVKIWAVRDTDSGVEVHNILTLPVFRSSVTALAWGPGLLLTVGMEDGSLELFSGCLQRVAKSDSHVGHNQETGSGLLWGASRGTWWKLDMYCLEKFDRYLCHVAAVHRLAWKNVETLEADSVLAAEAQTSDRIEPEDLSDEVFQLASCGADHSIRLFNIKISQRSTA